MRRIGLVVFPGFQVLDLAASTAFELANIELGRTAYALEVISERGGLVPSSSGMAIDSAPFGEEPYDTLLVTGEMIPGAAYPPGLLAELRRAAESARRIASLCTGAFVLAAAGLLEDRRATTHWSFARELQRRHARVRVQEDRIFIADGPVWSSAGMSACLDLALALVEADHGAEVARAAARNLVVYHRRAGGQSQFSALLELEPRSDRIQQVLSYAKSHLRERLSVEQLAGVAHLSPRQFSRLFVAETGQSPARAVERLRVEAARTMIESGVHAVDAVARESGFGDPERMRRAFLRAFGQPPQALRRGLRGGRDAAA